MRRNIIDENKIDWRQVNHGRVKTKTTFILYIVI